MPKKKTGMVGHDGSALFLADGRKKYSVFGSLQTSLLCIVVELAEGGSVSVDVDVSKT